MSEFALHPEAFGDLDDAVGYIARRNADAALKVIGDVFAAFERFSEFPHMGHRRPDLTSRPLRFGTVADFLIAYAPDEKPLWIVAVLHGRRNPRVMAAILRARE